MIYHCVGSKIFNDLGHVYSDAEAEQVVRSWYLAAKTLRIIATPHSLRLVGVYAKDAESLCTALLASRRRCLAA